MSNKEIALGIVIGLMFISLIVLFCILIIKLYIKKIKEHNLKELAFQKALNETIIETQEQVLENISRDLHDDVGQQLTVINLQLETMKLDSDEQQKNLAPISESLNQLSQSVRNITKSLNNQLVMQQDLLKAIATEMERLQKNTSIAISFTLPEKAKKVFTDNEKIIIFRIFQESINNSLKHAQATTLKVDIAFTPLFMMTVTDNGKGFTPTEAKGKVSLGLSTMPSRAASIKYHVAVASAPGKGTTLTLSENQKS